MDGEVMQVEQPDIQSSESMPERISRAAGNGAAEGHAPLFPAGETDNFRNRWRDVQGTFVDEPREAVQKANDLVDAVTKRLTEVFAQERANLEREWGAGKDVSTEDLRQALRRYRSFFDRLLSV
jgi:hypothetical protein